MTAQLALLPQHDNIIDFPQKKSNEWWTPARYADAAHLVMHGIDLDPASCEEANKVIRAKTFYTEKQNGLLLPWYGRVFLNPPYSSTHGTVGRTGSVTGLVKPFVFKLIDEYEQGNVTEAILLVTTDTDAKWFLPLRQFLICLADHKIMFHRPGRSNEGQFFGSCFVYLGQNKQRFIEVFSKFGDVFERVSAPRKSITPLSLWEGL